MPKDREVLANGQEDGRKDDEPADRAASGLSGTLKRLLFGEIPPDAQGVERALSAIRGFTILGFFVALLFGAVAGGAHGAFMAGLGAAAAFSCGSILGFLFGLPRWSEQQPTSARTAEEDSSQDGKAAQPSGEALEASSPVVMPNTNLHRITDWLTTLIVGLGLVHWKEALSLATQTSVWFTKELRRCGAVPCPNSMLDNGSPGAAILIAFAAAGFLLVFLWAVRYMGPEMLKAHQESRALRKAQRKVDELAGKIQVSNRKLSDAKKLQNRLAGMAAQRGLRLDDAAAGLASAAAPPGEERFGMEDLDQAKESLDLPDALVADLRRRYRKSKGYWDDPLQGFGPAEQAGYELEASVRPMASGLPFYRVTLRVTASEGAAIRGRVVFFLHHTLPDPVRAVTATGKEASVDVDCAGSFVAGVYIPEADVRLSLDLSTLPGVPQDFRDN